MTEYIKRKAAIDTVTETYYDTPAINLKESKLEAALRSVPVADVMPVVYGRWEWDTQDIYCCTICHEKSHVKEVMGLPDWDFCPNCGAKMIRGENNG